MMAQRFGPSAILSPAANTGRIGKGRESDGGTKIKPGRVEAVRNAGQLPDGKGRTIRRCAGPSASDPGGGLGA